MKDFFIGWRRKAGVVTLVMAAMTAIALMRSYVVDDHIRCFSNGRHQVIISTTGVCKLFSFQEDTVAEFAWHTYPADFSGQYVRGSRTIHPTIGNSQKFGSFNPRVGMVIRRIHYWPVVLVLTLLSACLILWKPRKRA